MSGSRADSPGLEDGEPDHRKHEEGRRGGRGDPGQAPARGGRPRRLARPVAARPRSRGRSARADPGSPSFLSAGAACEDLLPRVDAAPESPQEAAWTSSAATASGPRARAFSNCRHAPLLMTALPPPAHRRPASRGGRCSSRRASKRRGSWEVPLRNSQDVSNFPVRESLDLEKEERSPAPGLQVPDAGLQGEPERMVGRPESRARGRRPPSLPPVRDSTRACRGFAACRSRY